jgi:hypothetical protein
MPFSWEWTPDSQVLPSQELQVLAGIHAVDIAQLEFQTTLTWPEILARFDSEFVESKLFYRVALSLHCWPLYLKNLHAKYRRTVLGITVDESRAVGEARVAETQKIRKLDQESRRRKRAARKAAATDGPIWQDTWLVRHVREVSN